MKAIDYLLTSTSLVVISMLLVVLGKKVYDLCHRRFDLQHALTEDDNCAVAVSLCGYLLAIAFAISGIIAGDEGTLLDDSIDLVIYGVLAIVLLNISTLVNDRIIFHRFDNSKELLEDKNIALGAVEGSFYLGTGLILAGALQGEGSIFTAIIFWLLGQAVFLLISKIYNFITSFDFIGEIEKNNTAVGFAFSGLLIAISNLIRAATAYDFSSWQENLLTFASITVIGCLALPFLRLLTDKILLPRADLTYELTQQEHSNIGAGVLEATTYIVASLILSWML